MKTLSKICVQGIVQGVGFRPFIKRLADSMGFCGFVLNNASGVVVEITAEGSELFEFIERIHAEAPPLAHIISIDVSGIEGEETETFIIKASNTGAGITTVSPDVAICDKCRLEIETSGERRFHYPFTNCTNCGPRYSIIKSLPYDRKNTTMQGFEMCHECSDEYSRQDDRRFHAQPVACPACGPHVYLNYKGLIIKDSEEALRKAALEVNTGGIVALKGLGGYHLICSGKNDEAIERLRRLKGRKEKPFAVMCRDVSTILKYTEIDEKYSRLLNSQEAPIVIFPWKNNPLSPLVNPLSDRIGLMIAYTPLHVLLFDYLDTDFIVATSGNLKDEPIAGDEEEAEVALKKFTSVFLHHTRPIHNRLDDSLMAVTHKGYTLLRRSRGFAPYPVMIKSDKNVEIFASGANLKSGMAFYKGGFAFLSQYIGDLDTVETMNFYEEVYSGMKGMFGIEPNVAVSDIHPGYRSSIFASELGIENKRVQHHVAHFASCLAENAEYGNAVGVVLDGFGLGSDNEGWGGEFFVKNGHEILRVGYLKKFLQPGLDSAAKYPSRMLVSYLYSCGLLERALPLLTARVGMTDNEINIVKYACANNINSLMTTSAGRLFEAVGSLIVGRPRNEYEGDLAIVLESVAFSEEIAEYSFTVEEGLLDPSKVFSEIIDDIEAGVEKSVMAAKFHNGFISAVSKMARDIAIKYSINTVALSGGVFQNIKLLDGVTAVLEKNGLRVLTHRRVPANDGGIALGQLYFYLLDMNFS